MKLQRKGDWLLWRTGGYDGAEGTVPIAQIDLIEKSAGDDGVFIYAGACSSFVPEVTIGDVLTMIGAGFEQEHLNVIAEQAAHIERLEATIERLSDDADVD